MNYYSNVVSSLYFTLDFKSHKANKNEKLKRLHDLPQADQVLEHL